MPSRMRQCVCGCRQWVQGVSLTCTALLIVAGVLIVLSTIDAHLNITKGHNIIVFSNWTDSLEDVPELFALDAYQTAQWALLACGLGCVLLGVFGCCGMCLSQSLCLTVYVFCLVELMLVELVYAAQLVNNLPIIQKQVHSLIESAPDADVHELEAWLSCCVPLHCALSVHMPDCVHMLQDDLRWFSLLSSCTAFAASGLQLISSVLVLLLIYDSAPDNY